MRQHSHRLPRLGARIQGALDGIAQTLRLFLQRHAPIVGELDHFMRRIEVVDQLVVNQPHRAIWFHLIATRRVAQLVQAIDQPRPKPDAPAILLQVAAQDPRQYKHSWFLRSGHVAGCATLTTGVLALP
ncbi:hypothetical protein D3C76_1168920 [compost metagenome]